MGLGLEVVGVVNSAVADAIGLAGVDVVVSALIGVVGSTGVGVEGGIVSSSVMLICLDPARVKLGVREYLPEGRRWVGALLAVLLVMLVKVPVEGRTFGPADVPAADVPAADVPVV